jgi:hypothetical protein
MPILLDGNNLLHRLPGGGRGRDEVRRMVLDRVRHERQRVTVVFDGPPPVGRPARESLGRATVVWSGERKADDVIIATLPCGGSARQWVVVTDDRELARRARDRGAETRDVASWQSSLRPVAAASEGSAHPVSPSELSEWEAYFESGGDEDDRPQRVPPRRRSRKR